MFAGFTTSLSIAIFQFHTHYVDYTAFSSTGSAQHSLGSITGGLWTLYVSL
jgi:hypothetical protein